MLRSTMLPHLYCLNPFLGVVALVSQVKIHVTPFGDNFYLILSVNLNNEQQGLEAFYFTKVVFI
jgi:hypothetical protein